VNGTKTLLKWAVAGLALIVLAFGVLFFLGQAAHARVADPAILIGVGGPNAAHVGALPLAGGAAQITGNPELDQALREFGENLLKLVLGTVSLGFAGTMTSLLTNLIKVFVPASWAAEYIHLGVAVVVWLGYVIASKVGYPGQYETAIGVIAQILAIVLPLFGVVVGGQAVFNTAASKGWALWGYQRSDPKKTIDATKYALGERTAIREGIDWPKAAG